MTQQRAATGSDTTADVVLRADSICRSFGDRAVLRSATLLARHSSITLLFGRNGSGKSTLLRVAAGLLQPDQGVVVFNGSVFTRPRLHVLGPAGLFFLPERDLLTRNRTVRQHLDAVTRRFGGSAAAHVEMLRIGDLLDRMPDALSGGERRRAEVAIALTRRPTCLLADEPLMGIAPTDAELLCAALRQAADAGCAIAVSGHEVPSLLELADEVVWLTSGTTHSLGAPAAARRHWQFRQEYLGSGSAPSLGEPSRAPAT
jgi:lipopolysaccharide export system ATP-binding protein